MEFRCFVIGFIGVICVLRVKVYPKSDFQLVYIMGITLKFIPLQKV